MSQIDENQTVQADSKKQKNKETTETEKLDAIYLSLTESNLKTIEALISSVRWIFIFALTISAIVIAFLGVLGFKYAFPVYINKKVEEWADKSGIHKEMNRLLAKNYMRDGVERWKKGNFERAIEFAELSRTFIKKAFQIKPPENKEEEIQWGFVHGNLAYYYAECKARSKNSDALNFAKIALEIGVKNDILNLIDDFLYVVRRYNVKNKDTLRIAVESYKDYKERFIQDKILNDDDIQKYDTFYMSDI